MIKKVLALFTVLTLTQFGFAQTPDMYPTPDPEPVIWSSLNIVLFIVLPIILIIAYILYRRWVKRRNNKE